MDFLATQAHACETDGAGTRHKKNRFSAQVDNQCPQRIIF
jgi:hypothetical protein